MNTLDIIIITLAATFLFSLLFYLIYGKVTEPKFDLIAEKFKKEFGYTPLSMIVGKSGGVFFWGYKESYIMSALFFPGFPATKKTLTEKELIFFQTLKMSEISWFYIKYAALMLGLLSFISLLIVLKVNHD